MRVPVDQDPGQLRRFRLSPRSAAASDMVICGLARMHPPDDLHFRVGVIYGDIDIGRERLL